MWHLLNLENLQQFCLLSQIRTDDTFGKLFNLYSTHTHRINKKRLKHSQIAVINKLWLQTHSDSSVGCCEMTPKYRR